MSHSIGHFKFLNKMYFFSHLFALKIFTTASAWLQIMLPTSFVQNTTSRQMADKIHPRQHCICSLNRIVACTFHAYDVLVASSDIPKALITAATILAN